MSKTVCNLQNEIVKVSKPSVKANSVMYLKRSISLLCVWMLLVIDQSSCDQSNICVGPVCWYELNITLFPSMTYRGPDHNVYPVFLNGSQMQVNYGGNKLNLSENDVIIADGFARDLLLFNGQLPGPAIEVMEGVQVVVKVNNFLRQKAVSIHWHGIEQNGTYFMDGSAYITQCPIPPGQSFTYRFNAMPAGTHWYHAHLAAMRLDGLFGMLIVHAQSPYNPYFSLLVNDWQHIPSEDYELKFNDMCDNGANTPPYRSASNTEGTYPYDCTFEGGELGPGVSFLFDGRNRWQNQPLPLKQYVVHYGERYRFRIVNAGQRIPFQIQVDGHRLMIVASDGQEIQPIVVDSFYIFVGESIDFEIDAMSTPGRYWIRADTMCAGQYARGILAYQGSETLSDDPISQAVSCTSTSPCVAFNCPFGRYPDGYNWKCIPMANAKSKMSRQKLASDYGVGQRPDIELFMNFGMNAGGSVNGRRFMMPMEPLFQNPKTISNCYGEPCLDGCSCSCTEIVTLPYGKTVRIVVSNLQPDSRTTRHAYHPIHLHGYNFAVLAEKFPTYNNSTGLITSLNSDVTCGGDVLCAHPRWSSGPPANLNQYTNPVIKDTMVLPISGYVVIQFKTFNPGFWLFHCHADSHMMSGMSLVFSVAPSKFPAIPNGFPTCVQFVDDSLMTDNIYLTYP